MRGTFGLEEFRPGQEEVIRSIVDGRDTIAVMPTGAGKSLCYQLPALHLPGTTVVVSPLIALMKDQTDKLNALGVKARQVNSAVEAAELKDSLRALAGRRGRVRVCDARAAGGSRVHRDPEVHQGGSVRRGRGTLPLGVGARLPPGVPRSRCRDQGGGRAAGPGTDRDRDRPGAGRRDAAAEAAQPAAFQSRDVFRANLHYEVRHTANEIAKQQHLVRMLRETDGNGIVYCATVKNCDLVTRVLEGEGLADERLPRPSCGGAAARDAGSLHERRAEGDRRHQRFRHGHRQA